MGADLQFGSDVPEGDMGRYYGTNEASSRSQLSKAIAIISWRLLITAAAAFGREVISSRYGQPSTCGARKNP
jgi:hypothetical protein